MKPRYGGDAADPQPGSLAVAVIIAVVVATTAGAGGTQTLAVRGRGRYVRMYGTPRDAGYGYSLWEFQVFGP